MIFDIVVRRIRAAAILLFLLTGSALEAADISGFVRDVSNGESLPFAYVYLKDDLRGTVCNESGYYAITGVPAGRYTLLSSLIGYSTFSRDIDLDREDLIVNISLSE